MAKSILQLILIITYSTFVWGLVFYKHWFWFAMPVFPELPEISYGQAVGLKLFASLIGYIKTGITKDQMENNKELKNTNLILAIILPWLVLLGGYVAHLIIY